MKRIGKYIIGYDQGDKIDYSALVIMEIKDDKKYVHCSLKGSQAEIVHKMFESLKKHNAKLVEALKKVNVIIHQLGVGDTQRCLKIQKVIEQSLPQSEGEGSMKSTEIWECSKCGLPCVLKIVSVDSKLPEHLKSRERFALKNICPCKEDNPEWKRKDSKKEGDELNKFLGILEENKKKEIYGHGIPNEFSKCVFGGYQMAINDIKKIKEE